MQYPSHNAKVSQKVANSLSSLECYISLPVVRYRIQHTDRRGQNRERLLVCFREWSRQTSQALSSSFILIPNFDRITTSGNSA